MENKKQEIIILHDVDGRIYFDALKKLEQDGVISKIIFRETSVIKKILSTILKKKDFRIWLKRGLYNLLFRLQLPFIKNKTIVFGIAPYNIRFLFYGLLAIRNHVIYHTSWPYWWGDNVPYSYHGKNKLLRKIYKYYLNKFNFTIVAVTEPCLTSLSTQLSTSINKKFIPHSVNIELFSDSSCKSNNFHNVLFVGRLVKEKGVYEIAEAIKRLDNSYSFTFAGSGIEENNLKNKLAHYNNVSFTGHISDKITISNIFKQHDILVLPSKKINGWEELFGLVIIEAMACGMIVIASDHIGPKGIIKDGVNGFLISNDNLTDDLVARIISLNQGKGELETMRLKARDTAIEYSIDIIKEKWLEVLNEYKS